MANPSGLLQAALLMLRHLHQPAVAERIENAWLRTLEAGWDEAVSLIGEVGARVWRLYLAGGALAFAGLLIAITAPKPVTKSA